MRKLRKSILHWIAQTSSGVKLLGATAEDLEEILRDLQIVLARVQGARKIKTLAQAEESTNLPADRKEGPNSWHG